MPRTIEIKRDATSEEIYQKIGENIGEETEVPEKEALASDQENALSEIEDFKQEIVTLQNEINFYKEVLAMKDKDEIFYAMCVKDEVETTKRVFKDPGSSKLKKALMVSLVAITLLAPALAKNAESGSSTRYNTGTTWGKIITDGVTKIYKDRQRTKQVEERERAKIAREEIRKERTIAKEMIEESERTERTEANVHGKVMKEAIKNDTNKSINYDMGSFGGPTNMDIQQGGRSQQADQSYQQSQYQESAAERQRLQKMMADMQKELEDYKMEVSRRSLAELYE